MGHVYALFPTLSDDLLAKIRFQGDDFEFCYTSGYDDQMLQATPIDSNSVMTSFSLSDPRAKWNPELHDWGFSRTCRIYTPTFLFGSRGVAPRNARIGIAVQWISSTSKQRGVVPCGHFSVTDQCPAFDVRHKFRPMQLRGKVELTTVLYLHSLNGSVATDETHLASTPGTVLGALEHACVILDGEGSMFPIVEVNEPVQPLWYIECDWADPLEDSFIESVCLKLNKAHKKFCYLDQNSPTYDDCLMREIMASALTVLITKLQREACWYDIESGNNCLPGSVGAAVNYFITTLEWHTSTPEALSVSIRTYFDKNL